MGTTNASGGGWDESLHNLDGSHRQTAPTTDPEQYAAWKTKLDRHIGIHVAEAKERNDMLRKGGDPDLADLADSVAEATQGHVFYGYTTVPNRTDFYVFNGIDGRHTRTQIIAQLRLASTRAPGL